MAKSFKQFSSDTIQPVKRTSEKDLLDFLEQDRLITPPPAIASETPVSHSDKVVDSQQVKTLVSGADKRGAPESNTSNINNTANTGGDNDPTVEIVSLNSAPAGKAAKLSRREANQVNRVTKASSPESGEPAVEVTSVNNVRDVTDVTDVIKEYDVDVRQTFVLSQQYLEKLKNFVHTQRMNGQYDFTQKQALHQALDLLFDNARIEERPLQIRQKEEVRRQQIRKGKGK